jgi:hypothetical protein
VCVGVWVMRPGVEESKYGAGAGTGAGDEDESNVLPHKRKVLPRPQSILKTSTEQCVWLPLGQLHPLLVRDCVRPGSHLLGGGVVGVFRVRACVRTVTCVLVCLHYARRVCARAHVHPNAHPCGRALLPCSVPSPRASLKGLDRKISFADLMGKDLEEVNFCDNLHYSKQARKKGFWFFS